MPERSRKYLIAFAILAIGISLALFSTAASHERTIAVRTLLLGLTSSAIALPLAGLCVWTIRGRAIAGRFLLWACICLAVLPPYLLVGCWDAAFGKLGWLTSTESSVLVPLVSGWYAAIWVHALGLTPQFVLLILFGQGNRRTWEEQATLEATSWQVFWHVTLQRMLPIAILCVAWGIVVCSREIGVTDLYQIGTLAEQIYLGYSLGQFNGIAGNWSPEQLAAAGNLSYKVSICMGVGLAGLATIAAGIFNEQIRENQLAHNIKDSRPNKHEIKTSIAAIVLLLLLVGVPILNVFLRVGLAVEDTPMGISQVWRLENVTNALLRTATDHKFAFFWSAMIGFSSATVLVIVAGAGCWLARSKWIFAAVMIIVWATLCGCSGPAIGAWIADALAGTTLPVVVWLYDQTIFPAVVANVLFVWPVAVIGLWAIAAQIPEEQLEHAALESVGPIASLFEFGFWQNRSAIFGIWILLFAICFCELSATQMVVPPGIETLPQVTLGKLHAGVDEATAALTILTTGFIVVIASVGWLILRRQFHVVQPTSR